jgi:hypothetical protein
MLPASIPNMDKNMGKIVAVHVNVGLRRVRAEVGVVAVEVVDEVRMEDIEIVNENLAVSSQ